MEVKALWKSVRAKYWEPWNIYSIRRSTQAYFDMRTLSKVKSQMNEMKDKKRGTGG